MSVHGVSISSDSQPPLDQDKISIVVKGQDQRDLTFAIARDKKLSKLLETYCQKSEISIGSVQFLYKGSRVYGHHTPKELKMKKVAEIEALAYQTGGGRRGIA